ncbi:MAG: PAS domain S-box protein [Geobacteraceae bacterium]|nr:PAS domain S-box protein [Geobacteraceae bacterium]
MTRLSSASIRNQIIFLILLMTILPLCIIAYNAVKQLQHDKDEAIEMATSVAMQIQHDQKVLLAGTEQLTATVSILPAVKQHDSAATSALLAELVEKNSQITNIIIVDRSGSLWASAIPPREARSFSDRRYFKNAVATGRVSSGEYAIGKIKPVPNLSIAYPIKDRSGRVSDVMAVVFSLNSFSHFYNNDYASPTSSILLTDHKGTILYSSVDSRLVGKQDRADLFARMTAGPDEGTFEAAGNLGIQRIFSYRKLRLESETFPYMYIRTGLNKDFVLTKARNDLLLGTGTLMPAMLIMLVTAIYFCKRNILNKVSALQEATQRIAHGDLAARVPGHISGGELGDLGAAFNEMAQRLQRADDAQRESENKYRELVENANSIILKWDNDGRVIYFNEFAERFFGFSGSEIIGQSLIGTIVPDTESSGRDLAEMIRNICRNPEAYINNENENIRKNGERVWISWNNHALVDADGSKAGILSVGQDITERKRIESELQLSEQRFRSFVENANDVVFALTPGGDFCYVSPNWTEAFGYSLDETIGKPFAPFVHDDDAPGCFEFLQRVLETGEKQSGIEYRVRCKDGRYQWYTANASAVNDPYTGKGTLIGIGRDITEHKHYEEILRQSEEKFSTIFHASPDAIILSRLHDGMMLDVNESFARITGFTTDEVIGRTSVEIGVWNDINDRDKLAAVVKRHGEIKNFEALFKTKNGSKLLAQLSARTIQLDGNPCLLIIIRDITDRDYILSERLKVQKLESISVLAGGIAHNFNNVLTGIIGYISYARKNLDDTNKVSDILAAAEKSSYRAAGLARQLLTFSHGASTPHESVPVDTLVEESVSLFLSGSNVKGTITCNSHQVISADSQEINQAFNNIVLNALHAMPDGGTLTVLVDRMTLQENNIYSLPSGDYAKIVFKDSGCGIAQDDLNKVFDPYFSTKDTGTGLGLSTTHSIISKHTGHIDITSEVGTGTTVTILLPAEDEKQVDVVASGEQSHNDQAEISVLVMDDEELIRNLTEELLKERGFTVVTCRNGEEACARYREFMAAGKGFSIVILDLYVTDGTGGEETARRILDLDPAACLVASSGYAADQAIVAYETLGFSGSIAKPYTTGELVRTIQECLQRCRQRHLRPGA